ncbi:hypothetical protein Syun_020708 [Stephania yunnanensis]|uniref:Uncharacterized protein n=1 Tax=Stephania yunnanensis TaxID=152371 RepID=A0AAP0IFL6_9MAGN
MSKPRGRNSVGLKYVGYGVVTPSRRSIGKVRGYTFNINSGAVELLELDSFGFSIIPSSLDKLQRRRLELTQATPTSRKKKRYADPGASTSQMSEMVPRAEFDIVAEQLRKVMAFMHQQFGMTMDGAGLSQPPQPPPPHDQQ